MSQYLKKFAVAFSLFPFFALPASAADTVQTKGGIASFYATTTAGCVTTHRFLLAADESYQHNGGTNDGRRVLFLSEYDFDACQGVETRSASGTKALEKYELLVSAASVRVMAALDLSGTAGAETRLVDLTWSATGKPISGAFVYHFSAQGYSVLNRFSGTSRPATVAGTLGQEAISVPGSIDFVKIGSVTVEPR